MVSQVNVLMEQVEQRLSAYREHVLVVQFTTGLAQYALQKIATMAEAVLATHSVIQLKILPVFR